LAQKKVIHEIDCRENYKNIIKIKRIEVKTEEAFDAQKYHKS
jgi:hypothetical protein